MCLFHALRLYVKITPTFKSHINNNAAPSLLSLHKTCGDCGPVVYGWMENEGKTDLTLRVLHGSLLTRPNGSQSCQVGFSLLELSFFQLLELQNTTYEFGMTDGIVLLFIIVHIITIVVLDR